MLSNRIGAVNDFQRVNEFAHVIHFRQFIYKYLHSILLLRF